MVELLVPVCYNEISIHFASLPLVFFFRQTMRRMNFYVRIHVDVSERYLVRVSERSDDDAFVGWQIQIEKQLFDTNCITLLKRMFTSRLVIVRQGRIYVKRT